MEQPHDVGQAVSSTLTSRITVGWPSLRQRGSFHLLSIAKMPDRTSLIWNHTLESIRLTFGGGQPLRSSWVKHFEYSFFPKDILNHPSSPFSRGGRTEDENRELWHFAKQLIIRGGSTLLCWRPWSGFRGRNPFVCVSSGKGHLNLMKSDT